ncbi:hypothetical protein ANN_06996 [Periplaneta americana]|uniref:Uncharacterized protein n=1 Tax=Periplaneta americana TaxID=6978 RepID=A0ABQ8TF58_PERAM|nr:hypothetical protein ANN_06996 [Periplaneta americana]
MAGLCEGDNEPPGSLKAVYKRKKPGDGALQMSNRLPLSDVMAQNPQITQIAYTIINTQQSSQLPTVQ